MKKNAVRRVLALCLAGVLLFALSPLASAQAAEEEAAPKKVTFLSSYSLSFPTVERQIEGIRDAFQSENVALSYEFMDTKLLDSAEDIEHFSDYLAYKWQSTDKPDLVIVGDDSALQLAMDRRRDLFEGIPVIFESIDDSIRAETAHKQNMTGLIESGPLRANIDLACSIYPDATRVLAIVDNSPSGRGAANAFLALQSEYPDKKFQLFNTSRMTSEEIGTALQDLDTNTILLYYIFSVDGSGKKYTAAESAKLLFSHASIPVFYYQIGVGTGSLGGVQVDFVEMGRAAGQMALEVLSGTPCAKIPLVYDTPTTICFDYSVMRTYHIQKSQLPAGAEYINDDETGKSRTIAALLCCGTAVLLILLGILGWDNYKKNRREAQLLREQLRLQRQAEHDALTNLCNRRRFGRLLEARITEKQPTTLISFDIDHFKQINDTYGHQAGDTVLIELGLRMKSLLDDNISVFRCGGDEFSAIVKTANVQLATAYSEKVQSAFQPPFTLEDGRQLPVTISVGFARYPQDGKDSASLIACADAALYSVKRNGRGAMQNYAELI